MAAAVRDPEPLAVMPPRSHIGRPATKGGVVRSRETGKRVPMPRILRVGASYLPDVIRPWTVGTMRRAGLVLVANRSG